MVPLASIAHSAACVQAKSLMRLRCRVQTFDLGQGFNLRAPSYFCPSQLRTCQGKRIPVSTAEKNKTEVDEKCPSGPSELPINRRVSFLISVGCHHLGTLRCSREVRGGRVWRPQAFCEDCKRERIRTSNRKTSYAGEGG
jgi:hypothetical protein